MRLHADFSRRAVITPDQHRWAPSPQPGVERVMLDRLGEEKARATSIVRYAPDSHFPPHQHPGGEEILVLSGTFSDEAGDYPAGWYLRNPPGSSHQPFSEEGAVIFVKLWQMQSGESGSVRIDTRDASRWLGLALGEKCPLFSGASEEVCLLRLRPCADLWSGAAQRPHGAELLVLAGGLRMDGQTRESRSWIRLPDGDFPTMTAGESGATVYLKTGHLAGIGTTTRTGQSDGSISTFAPVLRAP